jgi:hypothetical protein
MDVPQDFEDFATLEPTFTTTLNPTEESTQWNDDWEFTYDGYIPDTIDPDWWFTIYIIVGCLLINFSLPLWIHLGKKFGFHDEKDTKRMNKEWEAAYNAGGGDPNQSGDGVLLRQLDDARSVVSGYSHAQGGDGDGDYSAAPGSVVPGSTVSGSVARSVAMSRAGTHLGFSHSPHDLRGGDTASVFSGTSGFTDALLAARPKRIPHARRHGRTKRIVVSKSCANGDEGESISAQSLKTVKSKLDVRMAAEFKKAEMELQKNKPPTTPDKYGGITPNTSASDPGSPDGGTGADDSRSEAAPSILSKLDADAISVRDAVDARDGVQMPSDYAGKMVGKDTEDSYLEAMWNRLMNIVDFDKEMKKFLTLAGHYTAQGVLEELLEVVEIAAIGRFMGVRHASAYIVVGTVTGFLGTVTVGFYECAGVLIPQAHGARNDIMVGRYMQLAIIFYLLTAIPGAVFWCFFTDDAVQWYKFDEETAKMAQLYIYATLPGFATYGIDAVLYEFLNSTGHEQYSTWFTLVASCIHTVLVVCMLYGGIDDLFVLGLFETASDIIFLALNFTILVRKGWLDPYWEGLFKTNGLKDRRAIKNVVNTAVPLSCAWILTYGEWEIMTLFCRHMGDSGAEVAAWGLMGYLWSTFETLTGTSRVGLKFI